MTLSGRVPELKKLKPTDLTPNEAVIVKRGRESFKADQVMLREYPDGKRFEQYYRAMKLLGFTDLF